MPESVTRVAYQAIADFSQLHLAANEAIADLDRIKAKEAEVNAASAARMDGAKAASAARIKAMQDETAAMNGETAAAKVHEAATKADTVADSLATDGKKAATAAAKEAKKALDDETESKKKNSSVTKDLASDIGSLGKAVFSAIGGWLKHHDMIDANTKSTGTFRSAWSSLMQDMQRGTDQTLVAAGNGFDKLGTQLQNILTAGNGRGGAAPFALLAPLIVGILAVVGPAVAGISALGVAVLGLAANLGTLSGVLAAAPAVIGAYLTSLFTLREAFKGVGTALTAWQAVQDGTGTLQAYQQALDKLTPSQRSFLTWLESMTGAWKNFKNVLTDNFFSQFQGDLGKIAPVFATITAVMGTAAAAVGQVVDGFINLASSSGFSSFLTVFSSENAGVIKTIGHALTDFLDIIAKISVAAAPLVQELDGSFTSMMDHLDTIVTTAANSGSLVKWLGDVYNNLHLWWGIVSDLAKTIVNYADAASGFGTWVTTGLKGVTDGWLAASEAAKKPGSSFQEWLGNVKPLVSELAKTIGDLLHWWNQTSSSPNNINKMLTMIKDINDHLGPALGHLLDTMSKTTIGPDLIDLISNLVTLVDTIMSNGGAQVIEGIVHFLAGVVQLATGLAQLPGAGAALVTIASALGTLALLSLGNKFVPILDLAAWLLRLADAEGPLTRIFNGLTGYKAPATAAAAEGAASSEATVVAGGSSTAGAGAAEAGAASGGTALEEAGAGAAAGGLLSRMGTSGKVLGKLGGGLGKVGGFLGKTAMGEGFLGGALSLFSQINLAQQAIGAETNPAPLGKNVHHFDIAKNNWGGVGLGALNGAVAGARFGPVGIAAGAGLGIASNAVGDNGRTVLSNITNPKSWERGAQQAGDIAKAVRKSPVGRAAAGAQTFDQNLNKSVSGIFDGKNWSKGGKQIEDFFTKTIPGAVKTAGKGIANFFKPLTDGLKNGGKQISTFFTKTIPGWIGTAGKTIGKVFDGKNWMNGLKQIGNFFIKTLPYDIGEVVGRIGRFFTKDIPDFAKSAGKQIGKWLGDAGAWLGNLGKDIGNFFTKTLPGFFKSGGKSAWDSLQDAGKWIADQAAKFWKWLTVDVPAFFVKAGGAMWKGLQDAGKWIADQATKFWKWLSVDVPGFFVKAGALIWNSLQDAGKWLGDQGTKVFNWITGLPGQIGKWAMGLWNSLPSIGGWISDQAGKVADFVSGIANSISKAFSSGVKNGTQGKHSGGTIYRAGGGSVPGYGDYDSVHAMLTPGEVVIRKSVVDSVGEQNLLALNDGLLSYQQLLTKSMSQDPVSKLKSMPSFLTGSGLAGTASLSALPARSSAVQYANSSSGSRGSAAAGIQIENLNVINPTPERTSDSLPRTIRKVGYLSTARGR